MHAHSQPRNRLGNVLRNIRWFQLSIKIHIVIDFISTDRITEVVGGGRCVDCLISSAFRGKNGSRIKNMMVTIVVVPHDDHASLTGTLQYFVFLVKI